MSLNYIVMILMWVIGIFAFIFVTPRKSHRKALIALLVSQALLWVSSLIHVEFHLIAFPVREFPKATDLLLVTEYVFYPILTALYIVYEPKRSNAFRLIYLSIWTSVIVVIDLLLVHFTDLLEYTDYKWYFTWISFFGLLAVTNVIFKWFFKDKKYFRVDREAAK
jgi:hypothetical protein